MTTMPDLAKLPVTRIADYVAECNALDDEAFGQKHGRAFLLHWGDIGDDGRPIDLTSTTNLVVPPKSLGGRTLRPQMNYVVFPIVSTGRSPYPHLISVGRTQNNDVVLQHESISKFHAFFKLDPDGRHVVHDAGSRNGTFLEDELVFPAQVGKPTIIESGQTVRFGLVELSYLRATDFCRLVKRVVGAQP